MNSTVAVADIASRTILYLGVIWAAVKLAPGVLPRLQVTNPRGPRGQRQSQMPPVPPAGETAAELDGQKVP